ncbi:MAG: LCP family protein [Candidatus Saccharimonadales bacterium]
MFTKKKPRTPKTGRKKRALIIVAILSAVFLIAIASAYLLVAHKTQKILSGNLIDAIIKNDPIKSVDGRTNFLIFSTSNDDPNPKHSGGQLTDSLVVLSVSTHTKTVYTISIPRDLWVDYDTKCKFASPGKINALYVCALDAYGKSDKNTASQVLSNKVSSILGIPIQYYIQADYTLIRSLTDALGGIDVNIHSNDSRGIYDPTVGLKLPLGTNHLDGKAALKLSRARNSNGGYGLPRSNFDREINQQRVIAAIFKKASTDSNLKTIGGSLKLINALSDHARTNIKTGELKSAIATAQSLDPNKTSSIPLYSYMKTANLEGQSIVQPVTGLNDYSAIQQYVSEIIDRKDTR